MGIKTKQIGNMNQHHFRFIGSGLISDNPLILKVFGYLREKENSYEEGCTRGPISTQKAPKSLFGASFVLAFS